MSIENRKSERLEADYAVAVRLANVNKLGLASITNLSQGGLCFLVNFALVKDQKIEIIMPPSAPVVTLQAVAVWCRPQRDMFSVGAQFIETSETRKRRIMEMHAAVTAYQKANSNPDAPLMSAQQAAAEWIRLYATQFFNGTA